MSKTITWEHDGLSFDVRVSGPQAGEPLLLHGFPQDSTCWDVLGESLVAAGYRTIAPDQRGYSPGARPRNVGSYSLDNLTGDVIALADDFELEGFHLVGHDWGGVVVWELAARRPERVSSLTSLSMPHPAASSGRCSPRLNRSGLCTRSSFSFPSCPRARCDLATQPLCGWPSNEADWRATAPSTTPSA